MEAVPSLCATGTIGVAALGFAFGQPIDRNAMSRQTKKRRATTNGLSNAISTPERSTLSAAKHPISAPQNKALARGSFDDGPSLTIRPTRPATSIQQAPKSMPPENTSQEDEGTNLPDVKNLNPRSRKSLQTDFRGLENIKPSYFKHKSIESFPRTESSALSSPPPSSSFSHSNSSTAPIIPGYNQYRTPSSRNKLVKRSSSQRMLNGSQDLHSSLRRPATSHQRSATIRQRYSEEIMGQRDYKASDVDLLSNKEEVQDDASSAWRPFFQSQAARSSRFVTSSKRKFGGTGAIQSLPATVVPDLTELPTLLMATSIKPPPVATHGEGRASDVSRLSRPLTPNGLALPKTRSHQKIRAYEDDSDVRPRTSFSFGDVFPSPSPLTWKMPRAGSMRSKKILGRNTNNRRVVSAPQSSQFRNPQVQDDQRIKMGNQTLIYASPPSQSNFGRYGRTQAGAQGFNSSPLPPLHRLSTFKLNLPETIPSYPTTPGRRQSPRTSLGDNKPPSKTSSRSSSRERSSTRHPSHKLIEPSVKPLKRSGSDASMPLPSSGIEDNRPLQQPGYSATRSWRTVQSDKARPKRRLFERTFQRSNGTSTAVLSGENLSDLSGSLAAEGADPDPNGIVAGANDFSSPVADGRSMQRYGETELLSEPLINATVDENKTKNGDAGGSGVHQDDTQRLRRDSFDISVASDDGSQQDASDSDPKSELALRPRQSGLRRRNSPPSGTVRQNPFEWSEQSNVDREMGDRETIRPKTVQGEQAHGFRVHRLNSRRGPIPVHLRSQSVPVPSENRAHANNVKLDSWALGKHGSSEDWSGDFEFEDSARIQPSASEGMRASLSSGMLVPKSIMDNQANVHGQFGQVRELTKLVEELKRLQFQGRQYGILTGQAAELWKEAEGIISLATVDDTGHDLFPPHSPSADFDVFDEDSPSHRRRKAEVVPTTEVHVDADRDVNAAITTRLPNDSTSTKDLVGKGTARDQSTAKAKSVLDHIHQQRLSSNQSAVDVGLVQRKLPFDTTSLKDLVTRAGVVTRALKEEIRKAASRGQRSSPVNEHRPKTPPDPPFSHNLFQKPLPSPPMSKPINSAQSPKSPKSARSSRLGGSLPGNDNEMNRHMKVMTVI